ncbi:MAG: hypothetical protein KGR26_01980 [Cyanobacteria bacterium REEB65]|nr:hypothetical protein [Cyanobacteria bacterium REEB65]
MNLIRALRLYANRCPHCGQVMRLYTWQDCPVPVPTLTHVRACPSRHYLDIQHLSGGKVDVMDAGGKVLPQLADVAEFPDLSRRQAPIHTNLNVPLRKPPVPARPAATSPQPTLAASTAPPAAPGPAQPPVPAIETP